MVQPLWTTRELFKFPIMLDGLPWWLSGKESACNAGLLPESGRYPGKGNGNPFQYSHLGNPMDRGALRPTVHKVTRVRQGWATKQQQTNKHTSTKWLKNSSPRVYLQNYIDIYSSQNWRQLKCPSRVTNWIYPMEYYNIKNKWSTDLCNYTYETQNWKNQTQKNTHCMTPFTWNGNTREEMRYWL